MLSDKKIKEITENRKLSKEQLGRLRSEMYTLAEIFFEELISDNGSKQHSWVIDANNRNGRN